MRIRSHLFDSLAEKAVRDKGLQSTLEKVGLRFKASRDMAFSSLKDPEALRDLGRVVKEKAIAHLPQLLEALESNVQAAGGVVHWASTAREARRIVIELALQRDVKSVVKSKSMISEEIGLNEALIRQGIDVWETDLGEYIIQLAAEPPSHLIVPAIHKSKEEINELFAEKLGISRRQTPEGLTAVARELLRDKFLSADMGITGANMAVAETGSILLVENEGNIRFCITVPRIHVAIMGIEKVVTSLEDLGVLLSLLARSATGQKLSTYTSLVTGVRREDELDGAEEFHLILVDNGRSEILADPDRRESLYCIRCGACLNVCPVYLKVGGHSYGWVYPGPIGSIVTTQLISPRLARSLPFASTLCGACAQVCPVKIDLPKLLLTLRQRLMEDITWDGGIPMYQRLALDFFAFLAIHPVLFRLATRAMSLLQSLMAPSGRWLWMPPLLKRWGEKRRLPVFAEPFSHQWERFSARFQGRDQ